MDKQLKVVIVDDEPIAQDIMETYLEKIPGVELLAKCGNAFEAFTIVSKQEADIMLLDINMPELSGISFLKGLKNPPRVIFTTAYAEYAVESYELNAVDYLLKPVPFERFRQAMNKAITSIRSSVPGDDKQGSQDIVFVKSGGKLVRLDARDILYAEGLKDYVRIWTKTGNNVVHTTMKNIEEQLQPRRTFMRIHKSYLINLEHVSEVNGSTLRVNGQEIPIGSTYRDEVYAVFEKLKLL